MIDLSQKSSQLGLLLLNLGTPAQPEAPAVASYLEEFLMDPQVVDIPFLFRWLLVKKIILPRRAETSAQAYQKVWTDRGSPLLVHLLDLTEGVKKELGSQWNVKAAMRYGNPSIRAALGEFQKEGVQNLLILPLYPQYSLAATLSSLKECNRVMEKLKYSPRLRTIRYFYDREEWVDSYAQMVKENLAQLDYDHVLFSFHGLPERQIKKTDPTHQFCLKQENCCAKIGSENRDCYRAQCYASAHAIAEKVGLKKDRYTVCFQSRLGATPWIKPYTDAFYREFPAKGIKKLAVVCPSFVADCLETLEEVQIRGKEEFVKSGGSNLHLIPSLNSNLKWAQAVSQMVRSEMSNST